MAEQMTHVDASTTAPALRDGVVKLEELEAEGRLPARWPMCTSTGRRSSWGRW